MPEEKKISLRRCGACATSPRRRWWSSEDALVLGFRRRNSRFSCQAPTFAGVQVEVLNVLGAGDAFMSGFLSSWLSGEDYELCAARGNGCGGAASRHGCSIAMPSAVELDYFLKEATLDPTACAGQIETACWRICIELLFPALAGKNPHFRLRSSQSICRAGAKGWGTESRIPVLKNLFVEAVASVERERADSVGKLGILADETYGQDALNAATGRGWWIGRPVELPGPTPPV